MVMVDHLMRMALIGMIDIHTIIMGVTMIVNVGLMLDQDFCNLGGVVRNALRD